MPGVAAVLGDNAYPDGTTAEFANCYDPTWGRHKARTRPAVGNHEYGTTGATGYYGYFGAAAGDAQKGYYSYDLGAWHIIVLNSNCSAVGGCDAGIGPGAMAARRPGRPPGGLHAGLLAPPALQLGQQPRQRPRLCSRSGRRCTTPTPMWC